MHDMQPRDAEAFVQYILRTSENHQHETKRVSGKMVAKALETICAFANADGGWLFLGVDDFNKAAGSERFYGTAENPEAVDELLRKLKSQLLPVVEGITIYRIPCVLRSGEQGFLIGLNTPRSEKVHSILDSGTWIRGEASNRVMNASEITELSYRRGVKSAESETVPVDFELLNTECWRLFAQNRGLTGVSIADQLYRIGLAKKSDEVLQPVRAAVLLFADEPGALLAGSGTRADIRIFHYRGNSIEAGAVPNLRKTPKTITGPLYKQIAHAHNYLLNELADGLTLAASGFKTIHRYPERVIKEAITNAVIHRDYRMNRDIQIRIFDNRIEVSSPGLFPGRITPVNISTMGSFARNPLVARNLREFPEPPNVDAGEGVRMMFSLMRESNLYPPVYRDITGQAQEAVSVMLLNSARPPFWEQVSDWINRNGPIANADLCRIASVDTLKASKMLKRWVDSGLLEPVEGRAKRNMAYRKIAQPDQTLGADLLSIPSDNKIEK